MPKQEAGTQIELSPPPELSGTSPNLTPLELIRLAVTQGANVEQLEKLMDLQERWQRTEARQAFIEAMKKFKQSPPVIEKTKDGPRLGSAREASYKYAPLDMVCNALIPALGDVGITHHWETAYEGEWMIVTCVLTHELGHKEVTSMRGCDDKGPGRNAIQASASTLTYLERYTLLAACGIAVKGTDTDGTVASNGELSEQLEWMANASSKEELLRLYGVAYHMFEENPSAIKAIVAARKKKMEAF